MAIVFGRNYVVYCMCVVWLLEDFPNFMGFKMKFTFYKCCRSCLERFIIIWRLGSLLYTSVTDSNNVFAQFHIEIIYWEFWLEHKSQKVIITFNKNLLTYTIILNGPFLQINQPHADNNVCLPSQAVAKFNIFLLPRRNHLITESYLYWMSQIIILYIIISSKSDQPNQLKTN